MTMTPNDARARVAELWPQFRKERERLDRIDRWWRWDHENPHQPRQATREYRELVNRAQTPYLSLVVAAVVQGLYVDGYKAAEDTDNKESWQWWQANGQDAKQSPLHEAAVAYGLSYSTVLPGENYLGDPMPVMTNWSPRNMIAFYEDPANDEWPTLTLAAKPTKVNGSAGWNVWLLDDEERHRLTAEGNGSAFAWKDVEVHDLGVTPVIRYVNRLDLEGRAVGEVEPYIAVAGRIDQTTFDRLVVQRFASWVVRTIAGMSLSETMATTGESAAGAKQRLKVEDILVAEDTDTKFGSLPASPLDGFNESKAEDVRDLAAVSQTAPHNLLGQMVNLSAEALAAADSSATRKRVRTQQSLGESHEQRLRLAAHVMGDKDGARDIEAQVRWRDTESRSLAQAADAWGKLVTMLGFPAELAWEKIPGLTQQDIAEAKKLVEDQGGIMAVLNKLAGDMPPAA